MLLNEENDIHAPSKVCNSCREVEPKVWMRSYAENGANILLCRDCSLQLSRKLLEDICELDTKGGRHG